MSFGRILGKIKKLPGNSKNPTLANPEEFKAVFPKSEERLFFRDKAYKSELFSQVEAIKVAFNLIEIYKDSKTQENALKLIRDLKDVSDNTIENKLEKNKNFYDVIKTFDVALKQLENAEKYFNNPPIFHTSPELVEQREEEQIFLIAFDMYKNRWAEKIASLLNEHGRKEKLENHKEHYEDRELIDRIIRIHNHIIENKTEKSKITPTP